MASLIPQAHAVDIGDAFTLGEGGNKISTLTSLSALIAPLIQNMFVLAGIIFLILLVFGGVTYIMNAGSGNQEAVEKGKNALTWAIFGFIIIFAAYWTVQTVELITGVQIFNSGL
jgi:hypothetical protein